MTCIWRRRNVSQPSSILLFPTFVTPLNSPVRILGTIWIAPSSLKGVNGYGVYTTRDLAAGDSLLGAPDGVSIPVEEIYHNKGPNKVQLRPFKKLFDNYWWGRGMYETSPLHLISELV
jgi:hypothetical protein